MMARWKYVRDNLEASGQMPNGFVAFGNILRALSTRLEGRQTSTKLVAQSNALLDFDIVLFSDETLAHNALLSALLVAEPGFAPYKDVRTNTEADPFNFDELASALAGMNLMHDDERYNFDWETWGVKEFDVMAKSREEFNIG